MSAALLIGIYSGVIVLGALGGALVPLYARKEERLIAFVAFAAGVLFGAAFFHMLPEAFHLGGYRTFPLLGLGFLSLFLLERHVLAHICEEPPDCKEHGHGRALGLAAFAGLSVHTLFDGVALGSAAAGGVGLMAFLAIAAHKVPSSLSLAAILKAEGRKGASILLFAGAFGLMVPLGAALYFALESALGLSSLAAHALAFSSGTFLYIAASDLLPHVNRHGRAGKLSNILALAAGLLLMFALTLISSHAHPGP